jgi:hypothetical protein
LLPFPIQGKCAYSSLQTVDVLVRGRPEIVGFRFVTLRALEVGVKSIPVRERAGGRD